MDSITIWSITRNNLRTYDTDALVLAIATFRDLSLSELWVALGVGNHLWYVPVHVIASRTHHQISRALLSFHSFTVSDQTSPFASIGRNTAWEAWAVYDEVTHVYQTLSTTWSISAVTMLFLSLSATQYWCMTVQAYVQLSILHVKTTCHFTPKRRDIKSIPPTVDAKKATLRSVIFGERARGFHHNFLLQQLGLRTGSYPSLGTIVDKDCPEHRKPAKNSWSPAARAREGALDSLTV